MAVPLTLYCAAPPAAAQTRFTVQQLLDLCMSAELQRQNVCSAYIAGVRQTMDMFKGTLKQRVNYCIPPSVTTSDVKNAFVVWAGTNTSAALQPAIGGVMRSIHETYPCRRGERFEF